MHPDNSYDRIASEWAAARTKLPPTDEALVQRFINKLPPDAHVLDLGCGTGVPIARLLVDHGADLLGIDRSRLLLDIAHKEVPTATFIQADLEDFRSDHRFDAILLWDVILHIERERHAAILRNVARHLHPGGLFIITSGGSPHPPFTDTMFGHEFFYDAHPPDDFRTLCRQSGFDILKDVVLNQPDGGRDKGRIGLLLSYPA